MFILLGITSVFIFEPVTSVAEVMSANTSPDELIKNAFPLSILFDVFFVILLSLLYGRKLLHYIAIFITSTILMLVLGLNVSIIGLVEIPTNSFYLVLELFGLIFTILFVYSSVFFLLEKRNLSDYRVKQNIS